MSNNLHIVMYFCLVISMQLQMKKDLLKGDPLCHKFGRGIPLINSVGAKPFSFNIIIAHYICYFNMLCKKLIFYEPDF